MVVARPHEWHLRFDRITCRNCDLDRAGAGPVCTGRSRIRPQAACRQRPKAIRGTKVGTSPNLWRVGVPSDFVRC